MDLWDEIEAAGCRRLWVLLCGLPPESALGRLGTEPDEKPNVRRLSVREFAQQVQEGRLH